MKFWRCTATRCAGQVPLIAVLSLVSLAASGCRGLGEAVTAHTDVVARAAGAELKVDEAADILASNPDIPAEPQVVEALASFWVDYTLLAMALEEDSTLSAVNLDALMAPAREQALMAKLRDRVIVPDTTFSDEDIARRWATDGPGIEIQARHILLRAPADATPEQRDSVEALAASLRQRAAGGEDFSALATEYSQDPGSAARGGDLGFFGRGRMVAPFEEAAFALETGEVSEVVESPFGYHIIVVDDRRQPDLAEQREDFRQFLVQQSQQEAETAYLDSLAATANVEARPGGLAVVREIAGRPNLSLRGRAAERVIASYEGGEFTAGEFAEFIRMQPAQMQSAFATADDEQLGTVVDQLARREVLLEETNRRDISLTRAEEDSIRTQARQTIEMLVQTSGFRRPAGQSGADGSVSARVRQLLVDALGGRRQVVPLGPLGFALRDLYDAEVNEGTFPQVLEQLESVRATQPQIPRMPQQQMPPQQMPQPQTVPTDTGG
jgi:hypothetical protein